MVRQTSRLGLYGILVAAAATCLAGCSLRTMAVNAVLPTLVNPAVYLSEEDPELVRDSLPFLLKTIESIIDADPERQDVLLFANTGFALYASAFLQADAAIAEWDDYDVALELNERARRMYLRARDYGLRNVEVAHPGITGRLRSDPEAAVAVFEPEEVESVYYLGGAWMLAISLGLDRPALVADMPAARALLDRALELDEDFERGALHSAFVTLEAVARRWAGRTSGRGSTSRGPSSCPTVRTPAPISRSPMGSRWPRRTARSSATCWRPPWPSIRTRRRTTGC